MMIYAFILICLLIKTTTSSCKFGVTSVECVDNFFMTEFQKDKNIQTLRLLNADNDLCEEGVWKVMEVYENLIKLYITPTEVCE